jgi:hypothetical protein
MDFGKLLKWVVIIVVAIVGWKYLGPKIMEKLDSRSDAPVSADGGASQVCVNHAANASEQWGSGLGRFVNPPYDLDAWGSFRADTEAAIAKAQAQCGCDSEACTRAKSALDDLRTLVGEIDGSIRAGTPPEGEVVRRQEAIDDAINEAREMASRS